jgi:hypothetical protein
MERIDSMAWETLTYLFVDRASKAVKTIRADIKHIRAVSLNWGILPQAETHLAHSDMGIHGNNIALARSTRAILSSNAVIC